MSEHPIESLMMTTMNSIENMVDVNTIIGEPIESNSGITIIPISKVSFGFAAGGSEFSGETMKEYNRKDKDEENRRAGTFFGSADALRGEDLHSHIATGRQDCRQQQLQCKKSQSSAQPNPPAAGRCCAGGICCHFVENGEKIRLGEAGSADSAVCGGIAGHGIFDRSRHGGRSFLQLSCGKPLLERLFPGGDFFADAALPVDCADSQIIRLPCGGAYDHQLL